MASFGRAFRHRNYRLYFFGQLVSLIGTWMQAVAQSWLVYRLTGSASALGEITFAEQIPMLFLTPVAGVLADRYDRRTLLLVTQSASMILAAILAVLTFADAVSVRWVEILAVIQGTVSALDMPVRQSFAVEMVGREDLPNAIALNSSVFNAARLIGPALAGLLVAAVGEAWCFTFNTASFLAVIAALAAMRLAPRVITPSKASILSAAGEGLSYSFRTRPLRYLFLTIGTLSFAGLPYATLIPVFADKQLAGGATANGMLLGANGLGAMVGALILAARTSLTGTAQRIVLSGILFGAGLIAFAFCRVYAGSLLLMVVVGFAMITMIGSCNTLIQSMVSDLYRGRVMAVYTMVLVGIGPFGSLLAGWLAERWGAPVVVAGGGGLCILSSLILQTVLTELRNDARAMMGIDKGSPDPVGANHS